MLGVVALLVASAVIGASLGQDHDYGAGLRRTPTRPPIQKSSSLTTTDFVDDESTNFSNTTTTSPTTTTTYATKTKKATKYSTTRHTPYTRPRTTIRVTSRSRSRPTPGSIADNRIVLLRNRQVGPRKNPVTCSARWPLQPIKTAEYVSGHTLDRTHASAAVPVVATTIARGFLYPDATTSTKSATTSTKAATTATKPATTATKPATTATKPATTATTTTTATATVKPNATTSSTPVSKVYKPVEPRTPVAFYVDDV